MITGLIVDLFDILPCLVLALHNLLLALVRLVVFYPQDLRAFFGGTVDLGQWLISFGSKLLVASRSDLEKLVITFLANGVAATRRFKKLYLDVQASLVLTRGLLTSNYLVVTVHFLNYNSIINQCGVINNK